MKNITKLLIVVMVLVLALAVFTACEIPGVSKSCEHQGGEATCTEAAVCELCGESYGEALGHSYTNYVSNDDATCAADGTKTAKCDNCDVTDTIADEGSKKAHTFDQENAELEGALASEADCENAAVYYKSCTCGAISDSETFTVGDHLGHDYTEQIADEAHLKSEATSCQEVDVYWYGCTKCDSVSDELYYESENAGDHSLATDWTTEEGNHFHECTVEGCDYAEDNEACADVDTDEDHKCDVCAADGVTQHAYGNWERADDDNHKQTCNCGDVQTQLHQWNNGVVTKDPSHTEKGEKAYTCTVCSDTYTEELPVLTECTYNVEKAEDKYLKSAATCTAAVVYYKSCICGKFSNAEDAATFTVGDPIAHTFDQNNTELADVLKSAADCENAATYYKSCTCGAISDSETFTIGTSLGHAYSDVVSYKWSDDNSTCSAVRVCANDAEHVLTEEVATVSTVALKVTATKVTFTYNVEFANSEYAAQTKTVEADVTLENSIATINAPAIAGRVASHDYVKFGFHDATATYDFTIYYSECDVWDGSVATAFESGTGTENDPYIIKTGAQLAYLAQLATDGTADKDSVYGTGVYYKLGASLDLSGHQWTPIAMYDKSYSWTYFNGNFDGANHKIIINVSNSSLGYGLFSGLGAQSVVKNLTLTGSLTCAHRVGALAYITQSGAYIENVFNYTNVTGTASGGYVGGLVGSLSGAATVMKNCVNYGTVQSAGKQAGGLTGTTPATVDSCVNFGHVICTTSTAGGISGTTTTGNVKNCVNYGLVEGVGTVGGIVGNVTVQSTITDSVNYGAVNSTGVNAGGIGGYIGEGGKISGCVNYGAVTNTAKQTGGILGQNKGDIADCDNYGVITGTTSVGGINGVSTGTAENCNDYGEVVTE